jgi:hypothetical protein
LSAIALIRPGEWELPLFVHVLAAMTLAGAVLLAATALAAAWRSGDAAAVRLGYRALLLAALPAWVVMRASAQWVLDESPFDDGDAWIGIGFATSEGSLPLLVVATVLAGLSARRAAGGGRVRAAAVLAGIVLGLYVVTIWAMTTKPA